MAAPRSISCRPGRSRSCRCRATGRRSSGRSAPPTPKGWSSGDPFLLEAELELRFGLKLGEIAVEDKPRAWPLGLTLARAFVAPRFALAGDAAHGIHPIAGQGLNLGFKDAAALAETIVEADRLGQDIGALDVLQRYERWRRFDTLQMGVTTDVLNRLFSNDLGADPHHPRHRARPRRPHAAAQAVLHPPGIRACRRDAAAAARRGDLTS